MKTNRIHINGLPFEFARSTGIAIQRGAEPSVFELLVTNPGPWRALTNPVSIRIRTDDGAGGLAELTLKNWNIVSITPHSSRMWRVTLKDVRWILLQKSFVGGWNIELVDDETRGKTKANKVDKTCIEAATEAYKLLSETLDLPDLEIEVDPALALIKLPKNLGRSKAGGFVDGTLKDIEAFLEVCRCDILPTREGGIMFSDRFTERSQGLGATPTFDGFIASRDIHWTKPKLITTTFEQRIEQPFFVKDTLSTTTDTAFANSGMAIENVVPNFDLFAQPKLREDGSPITEFIPIDEYVTNYCGYASYSEFLKNFLKPTGVPLPKNPSNAERLMNSIYRRREGIARSALFSTWKVNLDLTGVGRLYMDVKLGRLGPKGINIPSGYVFLDYSEYARYAVPVSGQPAPVEKIYNQKHRYDLSIEAPFTAHWIGDGVHDFVFKINTSILGLQDANYTLGLLDPDIQHGNVQDVGNGQKIITSDQVEMLPAFSMRVIWNGLLAADIPNKIKRLYSVSKQAFPTGKVPELTFHVDNVTANWGFSDDAAFPGVLLNKSELEARAAAVSEQIKESFKDAKAGIAISSGVKHLTRIWPGGNIYQAIIEIGVETEWSINTRFDVIPEVRGPVVSSPKDLDGQKAEAIS